MTQQYTVPVKVSTMVKCVQTFDRYCTLCEALTGEKERGQEADSEDTLEDVSEVEDNTEYFNSRTSCMSSGQ